MREAPDIEAAQIEREQAYAAEVRRQAESLPALIDSWINVTPEEAEEQRETGEYLRRVLDEDRMGYRKLFP